MNLFIFDSFMEESRLKKVKINQKNLQLKLAAIVFVTMFVTGLSPVTSNLSTSTTSAFINSDQLSAIEPNQEEIAHQSDPSQLGTSELLGM